MSDDPDSTNTEVEVSVLDPHWQNELPSVVTLARAAAAATLERAAPDLPDSCEISLVLADDERVRTLNRDYRRQDKATNVLAFANLDQPVGPASPRLLGDVVVARQTSLREAAAHGKTAADHLRHLVIHGVLHLLGFDHQEDAEARRMEALEVEILADLGIADPYAGDRQAVTTVIGG